ncbi:MAG: hypothetical protein QXX77_08040 [Candidatus Methanosuratincola sp.]
MDRRYIDLYLIADDLVKGYESAREAINELDDEQKEIVKTAIDSLIADFLADDTIASTVYLIAYGYKNREESLKCVALVNEEATKYLQKIYNLLDSNYSDKKLDAVRLIAVGWD